MTSKCKYYRRILDSMLEGVIMVDKNARILFINHAACKILHLPISDYEGEKVVNTIPNTRLHIVVENGMPELDRIQDAGNTKIVTSRIPLKDENGKVVGAVAVFRDITEVQHMAEEVTDLKNVRFMLETIIESTDDAISVADESGKVKMVNKAYTKLTGFSAEEVIGKSANVDIAEGESVHMKVAKLKKPIFGHRIKVGPLRKEVIIDATPLVIDGKFSGSVAVIHDVSKIIALSRELEEANRTIRFLRAKYTFDDIIGVSHTMQVAILQAKKVAKTRATVLLRGESGTGKELFAHAIHNASDRASNPFVSVNCAALPEGILESELFGYEDGAFTGAKKGGKRGLLEEANGGTLFLDEIGKMEVKVQSRFLRFLQEMEITRLGSTKTKHLDVRIIAATNLDLEERIKDGRFIPDLYYRLNVVPIVITPLRERMEDLEPLVKHIIRKLNQEYGRAIKSVSDEVFEILKSLPWYGNVRELENFIARAIINMEIDEKIIKISHLPAFEVPRKTSTSIHVPSGITLKTALNNFEKHLIETTLKSYEGNRTKTAEALGISLRTLFYKLNHYRIK
ncbi:sigma-54 interaction domain-containing protein [Mesoaciditoga lauensis]|uniref:sigma-54 interaction domain-containing protein n=1 Tax=Mesoaciditoga lauensis TaxID=1495039 RepID=UPI00068E0769|nr:sigma-54-dependent Fis family transcriptional regulator [Mesoaciditoga lauensis]